MGSVLRPPVIRSAAGVLDRSLFKKTVNLAAASVADRKKISAWRQKLQGDNALLAVERIQGVVPHPDQALASQGTKCLLLDPKIKVGGNVREILCLSYAADDDICSARDMDPYTPGGGIE